MRGRHAAVKRGSHLQLSQGRNHQPVFKLFRRHVTQQPPIAAATNPSSDVDCITGPLTHVYHSFHQPTTAPVKPRHPNSHAYEYDVLGCGQAAVDFAAFVDEAVLQELNVPKGGRRVISVAERASVMESLEGYETQVSAAGSLANTLVGLAQLAAAQERSATCLQLPGISHISSNDSTPHRHQQQKQQQLPVRIAMTGPVTGADALGQFAAAQLRAAGVSVVGPEPTGSSTGTVMVLSTADAQRSFLSCFSDDDSISLTADLAAAVSRTRLLVLEGYLWEVQGAAAAIPAIVQHARENGSLVALTAGDASVIQRHSDSILAAMAAGVDIWFGNETEAAALVGALKEQQRGDLSMSELQAGHVAHQCNQAAQSSSTGSTVDNSVTFAASGSAAVATAVGDSSLNNSTCSSGSQQPQHYSGSVAQECALHLGSICPMVAVTDGSRGSYITAGGQLVVVPPYWRAQPPVDTCGAGDAWAAGFLHGFLLGLDLHSVGHIAAKTASAVISRHTPQLLPEDADWVIAGLTRQQQQSAGGLASGFALSGPALGGSAPSAVAAVAAKGALLEGLGSGGTPAPGSWPAADVLQ